MANRRMVRVVGFDCAEDVHEAVLLDGEGRVQLKLTVSNRRDAVEEALAELMLAIPKGARLAVAVESPRSHGRIVSDISRRLGCGLWQVNTVALNHFRDVEGQPRKTDPWDAYLAARMVFLRVKGCREVGEALPEERVLCRLTRTHAQLTETRTATVQRLRGTLLELAPEVLHRSWKGPKCGSKAMLYLLEQWPAFMGLERAQLRTIEKILSRCRYGQAATEMAKQIREMARRITMEGDERQAVALEIGVLLQQMEVVESSLAKVFAEIEERVMSHPIGRKLLEMDGVGPVVAGVLIGELLPIARDATEGEAATYSGVTPLARKSGKSINRPRIARGVNKRVLRLLYQSGVSAVKSSAINRAYYQKKLADYAGHPKPTVAAYIALARQRHKVIYKLMTTDARYDKEVLMERHLTRLQGAKAA